MTHPLAGMVRDDGSVVVPAGLAGEVLRLLSRALVDDARSTGATPSAAARKLLTSLYDAAKHAEEPAAFPEETTAAPTSTVELTADEAARVIGSSVQWARHLASSGRVAARRVGRNWLIDAASLDDYRHRRTAA